MTSNNTFDDRFTCTKGGNPKGIDLVLKGRIRDLQQPAKMEESPMYSWLPTAPYWVVDVGEEYEYAVVYACVPVAGEYIYIFHRDPHALTKKLLDLAAITAKLTSMGIDASQVKVVQHSSCDYPRTDMAEASLLFA